MVEDLLVRRQQVGALGRRVKAHVDDGLSVLFILDAERATTAKVVQGSEAPASASSQLETIGVKPHGSHLLLDFRAFVASCRRTDTLRHGRGHVNDPSAAAASGVSALDGPGLRKGK